MSLHSELLANRKWNDRLGIDGHSGDETDHRSANEMRYAIVKLPWRSEALTEFLRALDALHLSGHFTRAGRPVKGALPRVRVPNKRRVDNHAKPVVGLPENFYDKTWLAAQGEAAEVKQRLQIRSAVDLALPSNIKR